MELNVCSVSVSLVEGMSPVYICISFEIKAYSQTCVAIFAFSQIRTKLIVLIKLKTFCFPTFFVV